eukprot:Gb_41224 [translate_table: standard]
MGSSSTLAFNSKLISSSFISAICRLSSVARLVQSLCPLEVVVWELEFSSGDVPGYNRMGCLRSSYVCFGQYVLSVSTNPEEISNADTFAASLASLISAVSKQNLDLSKSAFVSSANALENWSALTGLSEQLKGL